jgi:hypothetical protein
MHPVVVASIAAVAVGLATVAVLEGGPGRLLFGVAAVVTAAEALRGALLRPTIDIGEEGVRVAHGLNRRELLTWSDLDAAAMQRRSRRGATAKWLELDTGERLLTVPGYRLGAPVREVLAAIDSART